MNSVAEYAEEAYEYLNGSGYDVPSDILKDNVIDNSKIEIGLLPANPVTRRMRQLIWRVLYRTS